MRTLDALDDAGRSGIATDLYELTMGAAYFDAGLAPTIGTFELFVRQLPENRSFLVAAGLAQAIEFLLAMRFDGRSIDYSAACPCSPGHPPASGSTWPGFASPATCTRFPRARWSSPASRSCECARR